MIDSFTYKKIETIVRQSGDDKLDIDRFINKIIDEININRNIERVAEINGLPKELVKDVYEQYLNSKNIDISERDDITF